MDPAFATALRDARTRRRLSQLDLALAAGTTQRHVSFLERGRSAPGRGMVVRVAEALGLPLRERNALLLAAGFAPRYAETPLDDPRLAPVLDSLTALLDGHRPYPALIIDRYGTLVSANDAFTLLTEGVSPDLLAPPVNVLRLALHPDGMAPRIHNFADWAQHVLERPRQGLPNPRQAELLAELTSYLPAPSPPSPDHLGFAVPLQLSTSLGDLHLITAITRLTTAVDVTIAELSLETFLPADAQTAALLTAQPTPPAAPPATPPPPT
ncbi:helix-turn-helix transcriptional regulator [Amycolatopsis sp. NPDC051373]|uniref:helix-turn-helix transcriptional regulator n=1 Tax=Amycolatopsis sp. NPDC051373 TaxID=3155801 RepID=UPI00344B4B11